MTSAQRVEEMKSVARSFIWDYSTRHLPYHTAHASIS